MTCAQSRSEVAVGPRASNSFSAHAVMKLHLRSDVAVGDADSNSSFPHTVKGEQIVFSWREQILEAYSLSEHFVQFLQTVSEVLRHGDSA